MIAVPSIARLQSSTAASVFRTKIRFIFQLAINTQKQNHFQIKPISQINCSSCTCYSNELILDKEAKKQSIAITTEKPSGNELHLTFFFIGFLKQNRKKQLFLHRKYNTTTVIAYYTP